MILGHCGWAAVEEEAEVGFRGWGLVVPHMLVGMPMGSGEVTRGLLQGGEEQEKEVPTCSRVRQRGAKLHGPPALGVFGLGGLFLGMPSWFWAGRGE